MTAGTPTPEDDLAFIRRITAPELSEAWRRGFGFLYALWGAAFAVPLLFEWARFAGLVQLPDGFWIYAAVIVTPVLTVVSIWAGRREGPTVGVQARALNAVFGGIGLANIAVLAALIFVSYVLRDGRVMMVHAVVVFALQGAAWYAVWALRKRTWIGLVAAGWYLAAVALGVTLGTPNFILFAALGLILLMIVPGLMMMRRTRA